MAGLHGIVRLPRQTQRERRNANRLGGDFENVLGDGLTITGGGLITIDYGTGLQIVAGKLTTKDSEIDHDALLNSPGTNQHIDWTNATRNFLTTGSVTGGSLVIDTTTINAATITDTTGQISFGDDNLRTTGQFQGVNGSRVLTIQQLATNSGAVYDTNDIFHSFRTDAAERLQIGDAAVISKVVMKVQHGNGMRVGADAGAATLTDNTIKGASLYMPHYDIDEEDVAIFTNTTSGTNNTISFGGGANTLNCATSLNFYTAADRVTTLGTVRLNILGNGSIFQWYPHAADTDIEFRFNGTTTTGRLLWMEDEDYFEFIDDVKMVKFGCNGATPQATAAVNIASTDLATVIALCNQLRAALIANGICT